MTLRIEIAGGNARLRPGDKLNGVVSWDLPAVPAGVEVTLGWETSGKGTQDSETVETVRFDNVGRSDRKPFTLTVPAAPYSFSGKLISLVWKLEAETDGGVSAEPVAVTISPTGGEILLHPKR